METAPQSPFIRFLNSGYTRGHSKVPMPSLISHLNKTDQRKLIDNLNYLNLEEMRFICKMHAIPYTIWIEIESGERKRTSDTDRKSVVLGRIRHYLKTGRILGATCFLAHVVHLEGPPTKLRPSDRLYYGWYDKTNKDMIKLLKRLTDGEFKNGAIARILAREFWTSGEAPTFSEFAKAWTIAHKNGLGVREGKHPEAAWLTDRARNEAGMDWKAKRKRKAKEVLTVLAAV